MCALTSETALFISSTSTALALLQARMEVAKSPLASKLVDSKIIKVRSLEISQNEVLGKQGVHFEEK